MSRREDSVERWHRQPREVKQRGPKPVRCTNPRCTVGWEAIPGHPFGLRCYQRIVDLADYHSAQATTGMTLGAQQAQARRAPPRSPSPQGGRHQTTAAAPHAATRSPRTAP
jgi:hypothetical protein